MSSLTILRDIAPEFSDRPDDVLIRFIGYADVQINQTLFSTRRDYAVALMAAHILSMSSRSGAGGAISQMKEGDLLISFADNQMTLANLESTSYGSLLKQLVKQYSLLATSSAFTQIW